MAAAKAAWIVTQVMDDEGDLISRTMALDASEELLVPLYDRAVEAHDLDATLSWWRASYESEKEFSPITAFFMMAVEMQLADIYQDAQALALQHVHRDQPSNGPPDPEFASILDAEPKPSLVVVQHRLEALSRHDRGLNGAFSRRLRPNERAFWTYRNIELIRNHLHVAVTGDIEVTNGAVHAMLVAREIRYSGVHPLETPW